MAFRRRLYTGLVFSTVLLIGGNGLSQVLQPPGDFHGHHHADAPDYQPAPTPEDTTPAPGTEQPQPAAQPGPTVTTPRTALPPSLLDQPPQPAKVDLSGGKLTIHADNSSLTAILNQVSTSAGMTVDGLNKDERIFGTFGPGEPHEILSSLLDGTGYNVLMFGKTTSGTPSQLTLSPRGAPIRSGQGAGMRGAIQQNQEEEEEEPAATQYQETPATPPAATEPPPNPNGGLRSPQQMLQELQQMHQQQLQQQQQQQQQPQ